MPKSSKLPRMGTRWWEQAERITDRSYGGKSHQVFDIRETGSWVACVATLEYLVEVITGNPFRPFFPVVSLSISMTRSAGGQAFLAPCQATSTPSSLSSFSIEEMAAMLSHWRKEGYPEVWRRLAMGGSRGQVHLRSWPGKRIGRRVEVMGEVRARQWRQ